MKKFFWKKCYVCIFILFIYKNVVLTRVSFLIFDMFSGLRTLDSMLAVFISLWVNNSVHYEFICTKCEVHNYWRCTNNVHNTKSVFFIHIMHNHFICHACNHLCFDGSGVINPDLTLLCFFHWSLEIAANKYSCFII